jgi:hypothetical protein
MSHPQDRACRQLIIVALGLILWSLIPSSWAEDRWWGEITNITADEQTYTVETEDGRSFNVEWYGGYRGWDVGDTVILTVDAGFGFMVYGTYHTRVWVDKQ